MTELLSVNNFLCFKFVLLFLLWLLFILLLLLLLLLLRLHFRQVPHSPPR